MKKNNEFVGVDEKFIPEEDKQCVEEPKKGVKKMAFWILLLIPICFFVFIAIMMFKMATGAFDKAKDKQSDIMNQVTQMQSGIIDQTTQIQSSITN